VCKKGDYWSTKYTKEEHNEAREGFKRRVHQYLADNDIDDDFNKDITAMALDTSTPSSNFFYNDYGIEHFMTLNGPIPIETAKKIVTSMNNNAFAHSLTGGVEPSGTEPSIARRGDDGNRSSNDKGKSATYLYNNNPPNLTVDINFLNCHFDDNG